MEVNASRCWTVIGLDICDLTCRFLIKKATEAEKQWCASEKLPLTRAHRSAEALLFIWILSAGSRGEAVAVMGWGGACHVTGQTK